MAEDRINEVIQELQHREGRGVLFVPQGVPLMPENVIQATSEDQLRILASVITK